jgi:hypothetical protein
MSEAWLTRHYTPGDATIVVGIDWTESHRYERMAARWGAKGWSVEAPLCDAPYLAKPDVLDLLTRQGITPPRLYALGFAHNNCGGGCVKAGVGHFAHLYRTLPAVFVEWEREEAALGQHLDKPVTILRDRSGGITRPLPLAQLRRRLDDGYEPDLFDIGGCGCFSDVEEPSTGAGDEEAEEAQEAEEVADRSWGLSGQEAA